MERKDTLSHLASGAGLRTEIPRSGTLGRLGKLESQW